MTAPVSKNQQSRGKHPLVTARQKKGKGFLSLTEYKRKQQAELDAFKRACGG